MPSTVFVLLTRNLIHFVVKITSHSLCSSISSMVSASSLAFVVLFNNTFQCGSEQLIPCGFGHL